MLILKPSYKILSEISTGAIKELKRIEDAARICYKSEAAINELSYDKFVRGLIARGHDAMLEHSQLSVLFISDRGVANELTRHRVASFAQESTRYCNYAIEGKTDIAVIKPNFLKENTKEYSDWFFAVSMAETSYKNLIKQGVSPQNARAVLPLCLKTEVVITANYREWRHILMLRTSDKAHPEMQRIMRPLLDELKTLIPIIFEDINYNS